MRRYERRFIQEACIGKKAEVAKNTTTVSALLGQGTGMRWNTKKALTGISLIYGSRAPDVTVPRNEATQCSK